MAVVPALSQQDMLSICSTRTVKKVPRHIQLHPFSPRFFRFSDLGEKTPSLSTRQLNRVWRPPCRSCVRSVPPRFALGWTGRPSGLDVRPSRSRRPARGDHATAVEGDDRPGRPVPRHARGSPVLRRRDLEGATGRRSARTNRAGEGDVARSPV